MKEGRLRNIVLVTLLVAPALVGVAAMQAQAALPTFRDVSGRTLWRGIVGTDASFEALLVTDEPTFRDLWSGRLGETVQPPRVDFATKMVIAVFAPESRCGFGIEAVQTQTTGVPLTKVDVRGAAPEFWICGERARTHVVEVERLDGRFAFHDAATQAPVAILEN